MSKVSLNKDDYSIKVESDNLYHGDIAPNLEVEDTYNLNLLDESKEVSKDVSNQSESEIENVKKGLKLLSLRFFLIGVLVGIIVFPFSFNLSLKLCDFFMSLDWDLISNELLRIFDILKSKGIILCVLILYSSLSMLRLVFRSLLR